MIDNLSDAPVLQHRSIDTRAGVLHAAVAGAGGSPILLLHGFPETWRAFRRVLPLLAQHHRVIAVDLPGFGDSDIVPEGSGTAASADALHDLIGSLGIGPVHLAAQDLSGGVAFRLAAEHPEDVRSLIAVESGLAGYGAELLADVTHGGVWHIGALAAPGVPELLFAGRERAFIGDHLLPRYGLRSPQLAADDLEDFLRTYSRDGGLRGAAGLYRASLDDGPEFRALAEAAPLEMPVLAVGSFGGSFTADSFAAVSARPTATVQLDGVGHYVAIEAPERYATTVQEFVDRVEGSD